MQLQAPGSLGPLVLVTLPVAPGGGAVVTSTAAYNIGGTITGLLPGDSLVLLLNGANASTVNAKGNFTFPPPVASTYAVTVGTQPAGKTCTVSNGSGAGITASVSNIAVTCSASTYTIGGTVSGLTGTLELLNNGADALVIAADGTFVFATPVASSSTYHVTVSAQPVGQTCTVGSGSGANVVADVTNVGIKCATTPQTVFI